MKVQNKGTFTQASEGKMYDLTNGRSCLRKPQLSNKSTNSSSVKAILLAKNAFATGHALHRIGRHTDK